jgi:hypothetical protein
VLFGHQYSHQPTLHLAEGVAADGVVVEAPFRLLGQLDLGDKEARRRLPPGELDPSRLADHAAPSVAPDKVVRPHLRAVGQLHVDAGVLLREPRHVTFAMDRYLKLVDPAGQDALEVALPQRQPVGVPGGKVADVQGGAGEGRDLRHLPLRQEPIGDTALVEHLDRARLQTACTRASEFLVCAPLDDCDVDAGQRQLARQHQPSRATARYHHSMFGHTPPPFP